MSITRDSSIDTGYAGSDADTNGSATTIIIYTDSVSMQLGSTPGDGSGNAISFSGDATAAGTDTFAQMLVDAMIADNGSSTTLSLSADLLAAAAAAGYDPFASTTIWYVVSGPVDSYIQIAELETYTVTSADGSVVIQAASVDFDGVVLDDPMACDNGTGDPPPVLPPAGGGSTPPPDPGCDCGCDDCGGGEGVFSFEGNVAVFAFDANAFGEDTFASVNFDALTFEDSLSTITGVVEVAVG